MRVLRDAVLRVTSGIYIVSSEEGWEDCASFVFVNCKTWWFEQVYRITSLAKMIHGFHVLR